MEQHNEPRPIDEWIGIAKFRGRYYEIFGSVADFILDYASYDPVYTSSPDAENFRSGVITVTDDNAPAFLNALQARIIGREEVASFATSEADDQNLLAAIDFDNRVFVHAYYDQALEDYVPSKWRGKLGDPRRELQRWLAQV